MEDNPGDRNLVRYSISEFEAFAAELFQMHTMREALDFLKMHTVYLVLLDLGLPDSVGTSTLNKMVEVSLDIPVIVLTGLEDNVFGRLLISLGAEDYLAKSRWNTEVLERTVRHAIEWYRRRKNEGASN